MDTAPNVTRPPDPIVNTAVRPRRWFALVWVAMLVIVFWYFEFVYQHFVLQPGTLGMELVRSLGLTGVTLISAALFCSIVFKFYPRLAVHWHLRRRLGVAGFVFICFHVLAALKYFFFYDLVSVYYSWNPLENPVVFGTIAFPIFFVMAATSTDWAVRKLKRWWKFIHRFVYIAFLASIFHFILINPAALYNPAGYLLLALTAATLLGQLYWYVRISSQKRFHSLGTVVGAIIILTGVVVGYLAYHQRYG